MKRGFLFTLVFGFLVVCSTEALSRICFITSGDDCRMSFDSGLSSEAGTTPKNCSEEDGFSSFVREEDRYTNHKYSIACQDTQTYYIDEGCADGYTTSVPSFPEFDENYEPNLDNYICADAQESGADPLCCANWKCREDFQICGNNSQGDEGAELCIDSEGKKYTECSCDASSYISCSGVGLDIPSNSVESCTNSKGQTYYKSCDCAGGYFYAATIDQFSCDCTYGCTWSDYIFAGSGYCASRTCDDEPVFCPLSWQSDFDNYWVGYDTTSDTDEKTCDNLTVDCDELGYGLEAYSNAQPCSDLTEPYRCPFDHSKVYCRQGLLECPYYLKSECEADYTNSVCRQINGCWEPMECKAGYTRNNDCPTDMDVNESDGYCGVCESQCPEGKYLNDFFECECIFENSTECERYGLVCDEIDQMTGCFVPTGCLDEYEGMCDPTDMDFRCRTEYIEIPHAELGEYKTWYKAIESCRVEYYACGLLRGWGYTEDILNIADFDDTDSTECLEENEGEVKEMYNYECRTGYVFVENAVLDNEPEFGYQTDGSCDDEKNVCCVKQGSKYWSLEQFHSLNSCLGLLSEECRGYSQDVEDYEFCIEQKYQNCWRTYGPDQTA